MTPDEQVSMFCSLTGATSEQARRVLDAHDGDIELAVDFFLTHGAGVTDDEAAARAPAAVAAAGAGAGGGGGDDDEGPIVLGDDDDDDDEAAAMAAAGAATGAAGAAGAGAAETDGTGTEAAVVSHPILLCHKPFVALIPVYSPSLDFFPPSLPGGAPTLCVSWQLHC